MLVLGVALLSAIPAVAGLTERVSVATGSTQANGNSGAWWGGVSMSGDGRYVAFASEASNLVPGDSNGETDVFVRDRNTGQTTCVSVTSGGLPASATSNYPAITPDGRYVAFQSNAADLVTGDTNGYRDVFVRDRTTGQTTRASVTTAGVEGNHLSGWPAISADGRYVAFESYSTNLVPGDTNDVRDVFVHDRTTGETTCASVAPGGGVGNEHSWGAAISADGRYVAFASTATDLVTGDINGHDDIFVRDRDTGQTTRASVAASGGNTNGYSVEPALSADGRYVAFRSAATNVVPGDPSTDRDVFVRDRTLSQTECVSRSTYGVKGSDDSWSPAISADGRYVAFDSDAPNLVLGDTNAKRDVFIHDRDTDQTTRVSVGPGGTQGNGESGYTRPSVSTTGRYVAFSSWANNFVAGDTNGKSDVFAHDRWALSLVPELLANWVVVDPNPTKVGWPCTIITLVQNLSQTTAPPCTVAVWRHRAGPPVPGARGDYSHTTDRLGPGATQTFTDTFTPSYAGARTAFAIVDVNNEVEEEDENNNVTSAPYTIDPTDADLTFQTFTVTPDPVNLGNEAMITAAITNQGTDPSTDCLLQLWRHRTAAPVLGTRGDFTHAVGPLDPTETETFTSRFYPHFQNYRTAWGLVDSLNLVAEQDESNNKTSYQYKIDPGDTPDLTCAVSATPNPVTLGEAVTLTVEVENTGTVDSGVFMLGAWRHRSDAPIIGSPPDVAWEILRVPVGFSASRADTFVPNYPGPRTAWGLADCTNAVIENNEGNNIAHQNYAIVVGDEPDLVPTVTVTPNPTSVGATTTLRIDVSNVGSSPAGPFVLAAWRHRATAPAPATPAQLTWPMVGLGTAATVSVTDTFTPGFAGGRVAWAFVDHGQAVVEVNETNNIGSYDYAITAAGGSGALAVTAASAESTRGGQVAITYSLSVPANVELRIRNIAGRLVARLRPGEREAGASTETWTGLGNGGARVPAGVYLCEIVARNEGGQSARAIASVRLGR